MIRCDGCDAIFDSDADPECFVEVGNMRRLHKEIVLCEWCREQSIGADEPCDGEIDFTRGKPLGQSLAELRAQEEVDRL